MDVFLQQKIDDLKQKNLFRTTKGEWDGDYINFTSNDYLGLSRHPAVVEAGILAAAEYGSGATASRVAGGNHPLYEKLEDALAAFKKAESACVFGSGYLANFGVVTSLMGEGDLIISDKLSHSCLIEASLASGAEFVRFKHNDVEHLRELLAKRKHYKNCLIITEEIFSMDGDLAPIEEIRSLKNEFDTWLLVDGAHSLYTGEWACQENEIYIGTMSKSLGAYGGYAVGSRTLVEYLKTKAKTFIYSTGLPPFVIGAALKSLEIIRKEKPYIKALENTNHLLTSLRGAVGDAAIHDQAGLPRFARNDSTIVPMIFGSEEAALNAELYLKNNRILVSAIRPPTVPRGSSRLRISLTATHLKSEIDLLANCLNKILYEKN